MKDARITRSRLQPADAKRMKFAPDTESSHIAAYDTPTPTKCYLLTIPSRRSHSPQRRFVAPHLRGIDLPGEVRHLDGLFWDKRQGFTYGPGFKAYASDFPPGTKLIVTARIELPSEESL